MQLTKNQFDILSLMAYNPTISYTQRELAKLTNLSLGTVNNMLNSLELFLTDGLINEEGLKALDPYRVRRAVFICAGFGSRMVPVTLNTPKPLVRVKGQRIIDTLLDACEEADIEEIIIVRGYLGEQFDQLLYKYKNIKFLDNPLYNETNNISSAFIARDYFQNAYVLEGDLLLYNPNLITKYQYQSNYLGVKVDKTDDWCFKTSKGIITSMAIGGRDCYHMYGISYWTNEDGKKLASDIERVFNSPGGKERFWDQVPLEYCLKNYEVSVRECTFEDIIEIDTYSELQTLDPSYV